MSKDKKSSELLPQIINAKTKEEAVDVLRKTMEALHLTNDYADLVHEQDTLQSFEREFKGITQKYKELESPKRYTEIHEIRVELNFLYRNISDELSFSINKNKIYYEEVKTRIRAEAMLNLKEDKEFQKKIKATSTSALRDIIGADEGYAEYISLASISYGNYQNLGNLLNSVRQFTDSMASESGYLKEIERKDAK